MIEATVIVARGAQPARLLLVLTTSVCAWGGYWLDCASGVTDPSPINWMLERAASCMHRTCRVMVGHFAILIRLLAYATGVTLHPLPCLLPTHLHSLLKAGCGCND